MYGSTDDEVYDRLAETIEDLARLVEAGMPGRTPVAYAFEQAGPCGRDDHRPTVARMNEAITLYRALPAEQRQRIGNGWVGDVTNRPTRRELEAEQASLSHRAVATQLIIEAGASVSASQRWELDSGTSPAELRIRFGTSKAEALASIDAIRRAVADWYEVMITKEYSNVDSIEREQVQAQRDAQAA